MRKPKSKVKASLQRHRELVKRFYQKMRMDVNKGFTNSCREDYKSFFLKKSAWESIQNIHNWHGRGSASRFAEALGITRQYASMIVTGKAGCSAFVMRKIKRLININGGCWCHLFEDSRCDDVHPNHPILNHLKEDGEIPYNRFSESAHERHKDYDTERKEF